MNNTQYRKENIGSDEIILAIEQSMETKFDEPQETSNPGNPSRRSFLKGIAAGGLAVVIIGSTPSVLLGQDHTGGGSDEMIEDVTAWVRVEPDNTITAFTPKVEYGQGIRQGLSMIVAEEIGVPMEAVELIMGNTDRVPPDPTTGTWGSQSTISMYPRLRKASALTRQALINMAAGELDTSANQLEIQGTRIVAVNSSGKNISFGELVEGSSSIESIPSEPDYKTEDARELFGKDRVKVDTREKVLGHRTFASDVTLDGMLHGAVLRDQPGGKMDQFDPKTAKRKNGVVEIVQESDYLVVLAERTDIARNAVREQVDEPWPGPELPSDNVRNHIQKHAQNKQTVHQRGNIQKGLENADHRINVQYYTPYIQHAPIEPDTATARWKGNQLKIWTGTQAPFLEKKRLSRHFNLPRDAVQVLVPDVGGAFGGKSDSTVQVEAATAAKKAGRPVQIQWTREEQFAYKYYRHASLTQVQAGITKDGRITAWDYHTIGQGTRETTLPYNVDHFRVSRSESSHLVDTGAWRGVSGPPNNYVIECAIDELAAAIDADPAEFRLRNMKRSRSKKVLKRALNEFGWKSHSGGDTEGIGVAFGVDVGTEIAECLKLNTSNENPTNVNVQKVVCSMDPGLAINPEGIRLQIEGGIIMGLSSALYETAKFGGGEMKSTLYDSYPIAMFRDVPEIEGHIVDTGIKDPKGVGEPPIFPIAPALYNAYHNATGTRKRELPLIKSTG